MKTSKIMPKKTLFFSIFILVSLGLIVSGCLQKPVVKAPVNQDNKISVVEEVRQEIGAKYNIFGPDGAYVNVRDVAGDFARGTVKFKIGGGNEWWSKQVNGSWVIFLETQEDPPCSVLQQNSVPITFYSGNCWLDGGGSEVLYDQYLP